jgi:hypothetical protein
MHVPPRTPQIGLDINDSRLPIIQGKPKTLDSGAQSIQCMLPVVM